MAFTRSLAMTALMVTAIKGVTNDLTKVIDQAVALTTHMDRGDVETRRQGLADQRQVAAPYRHHGATHGPGQAVADTSTW